MDKHQFKNYYLKLSAVVGGGYILLLILFVFIFLTPQSEKLKDIEKVLAEMNTTYQQYYNFDKLAGKIKLQREEVSDIIKNFYEKLMTQETMEQDFLEEIGKISSKSRVKLDKVVPKSSVKLQRYEKQAWNLNFTAGFKNISEFFGLLENSPVFFGIEKLKITSGREKRTHKVIADIYTIFPVPVSKLREKAQEKLQVPLFNLPSATHNVAKNIKEKQSEIVSYKIKKDPMYFGDTIFPVKKRVIPPPKLDLEGIIWDPHDPMAVINGRVLKRGEVVEGARVIKITKTSVTLRWRSRQLKLNLKEEQ